MRRRVLLSAALCLVAMVPLLVRAAPVTVRLGFIKASLPLFQSLPLHIAEQKGMFEKEGLKVEIVPLRGTDAMVAALDANQVDITLTAIPYLVHAVLKGSDAVAVVGGPANMISTLVARPEIKDFADLKGKMIGLTRSVDIISIGTRKLLEAHGVQDGDYRTRVLIGSGARAKCLEAEDCAAVPLAQPDDVVFARKGYHVLGDTTEVLPVLQFAVFAARRSWAAEHKDVVIGFARAMGEADAYMRDPKKRAEVIAMGAASTGTDKDIAARMYKLFFEPDKHVIPKHAEINVAGIAEAIKLLGASGQLKEPLPPAKKFVDLEYLKSAGLQ